jgi:DNA-binding response OmpR family regulator
MEKIIQIVEDDDDIQFILNLVLTDEGFVVEAFSTIAEFHQRSRIDGVHLIILDVRLPDGSGIDLSKRVKDSPYTANIPVIIMSAHANGEFAISEGRADHFLAKPFDLETFVEKIKVLTDYSA